jgi:FKBP-type peptidyl-prolyl cis-trans isomerase
MSLRRVGVFAASLCLFSVLAAVEVRAQDAPAQEELPLNTTTEKASYIIGFDIGTNIKDQGLQLEMAQVLRGMAEALEGKEHRFSPDDIRTVMGEYQKIAMAEIEARIKAESEKNLREGQEFLKANALKEGVRVLESGLQYKVLVEGTGASPTAESEVKTHYHGTLINGEVFDSSVERGEPAVFPVGGVIRGWVEALQKMKVGDKWEIYVPSELAYGPEGAQGAIGPNQVLIFQIELLEIVQ